LPAVPAKEEEVQKAHNACGQKGGRRTTDAPLGKKKQSRTWGFSMVKRKGKGRGEKDFLHNLKDFGAKPEEKRDVDSIITQRGRGGELHQNRGGRNRR